MWQFLIGAAVGYWAGKSNSENAGALKPVAKAALKAGIRIFEKGVEAAAHLKESAEDIFAEAQADMEAQAAAAQARQEQEHDFKERPPRRRPARKRTRAKRPESEKPEEHAATSEH